MNKFSKFYVVLVDLLANLNNILGKENVVIQAAKNDLQLDSGKLYRH